MVARAELRGEDRGTDGGDPRRARAAVSRSRRALRVAFNQRSGAGERSGGQRNATIGIGGASAWIPRSSEFSQDQCAAPSSVVARTIGRDSKGSIWAARERLNKKGPPRRTAPLIRRPPRRGAL